MFLIKSKEHAMSFRMKDITLSQLVKCTGLKPRTLQFWTLNGVIHCDPETQHGGPGVPRRYSEDEVAIALILSEVIRMPLQVGALREIAGRVREIVHFGPENGVTDPVHWRTSDDRDALFEKCLKLKDSSDWNERRQAAVLREKQLALDDWCALQIALRGIQSVVIPGYKRVPVEEQLLELAVDDTGRWRLSIVPASDHDASEYPAPPVWSLRLMLNLTRTFARLPGYFQQDSREGGGRPRTGKAVATRKQAAKDDGIADPK